MRYGDDCDYPKRVTLHAGASEAASNAYFPAYNDIVTNNLYRGCGPRAALNVLSYFDVATNIYNVWGPVPTIDNPFNDQRATLPDDLRSGLESLLNSMGKGHFRVKRISGQPVAKIKNLLTGGYPVIALVNNGGHYVTFTGYENGKYRVTDYYGSDRWVAENDIDIGFRNFPAWFSFISTGTGGYKAGTLLYVERDNVCQCSGAGTTAHGSNGCTKTCDGCWWGACYGGNHDDPPPPPGGQPF
jgi:hypothetical protein